MRFTKDLFKIHLIKKINTFSETTEKVFIFYLFISQAPILLAQSEHINLSL